MASAALAHIRGINDIDALPISVADRSLRRELVRQTMQPAAHGYPDDAACGL